MAGKSTGGKVASSAGRTLGNANASGLQRSLAGSALAQSGTNKTTSKPMEAKAAAALQNSSSASTTKALAGSLVSQSKSKK
jgi:hypothetical protein